MIECVKVHIHYFDLLVFLSEHFLTQCVKMQRLLKRREKRKKLQWQQVDKNDEISLCFTIWIN